MSHRSATDIADILAKAGWPPALIPEAVWEAMRISRGDNSFTYTLSNGIKLVGLFGIAVAQEPEYWQGSLYSPALNAKAALDLYSSTGSWSQFWLAMPPGAYSEDIKTLGRHLATKQPTTPLKTQRRLSHNERHDSLF